MKNKKLTQGDEIKCVNYREELVGECFYLGIFSGRCFKFTNPLELCKEVKEGRIQLKE